MSKSVRSWQRGFTLIELMIVVVLGVLLLTTGVPSFLSFIENNRVVAQTNNYVSGLNIARSEAIKTGARVVLCKSDDGQSCDIGGAGYERGWAVFVDDGATAFDIDGGERILRVQEPLTAGVTLIGNANVVNRVAYLGTGRAVNNGTLVLCLGDHERRNVVISRQGRVRTQQMDVEGSAACP
jgi:type IV fimbrial biogenesis protein FimT